MRESLELDQAALAAYLEAQVPGFRGPLTATKFKGGQSNPTYRIDATSGSYVLRRKPPGKLLASAHAVDREFRVLQALHGGSAGAPVARPLHLCTDESIIGSMFYLMEFVDGRIFWDPALPDIAAEDRARYYDAIIDAMAAAGIDIARAFVADPATHTAKHTVNESVLAHNATCCCTGLTWRYSDMAEPLLTDSWSGALRTAPLYRAC